MPRAPAETRWALAAPGGAIVAEGRRPEDFDALATIVRGICYDNAKNYFKL